LLVIAAGYWLLARREGQPATGNRQPVTALRITYIGHATLLLEMGGATILTDPNFDPKLGRILPRVSPPGIALENLPALDAILLTHAHADHLSFDSLERLPKKIPLLAPPVVAKWLRRLGHTHAVDLAPDEDTRVSGVNIHAASATHRGNRYGYDRWRSAANMYLIDDAKHDTLFFAGDTALVGDTHRMVERVLWDNERELDLALLPIGYAPWWKPGFRKGHLTHDDALTLFEKLRARLFVPYHWGTFRHVTSTAHDAIRRLRQRLESHHLRSAVRIVEPGESLDVNAALQK
jgi:L-ascorbate metabolism protein UlaG (beta-lactamase superfamily)